MGVNIIEPAYILNLSSDPVSGLRNAELTLNRNFPKQYLGTYLFNEWTYGEKLTVELAVPPDEDGKRDIEKFIVLETTSVLRKAPFEIKYDIVKALPGRLGTLLSNIATYVDAYTEEEKKG